MVEFLEGKEGHRPPLPASSRRGKPEQRGRDGLSRFMPWWAPKREADASVVLQVGSTDAITTPPRIEIELVPTTRPLTNASITMPLSSTTVNDSARLELSVDLGNLRHWMSSLHRVMGFASTSGHESKTSSHSEINLVAVARIDKLTGKLSDILLLGSTNRVIKITCFWPNEMQPHDKRRGRGRSIRVLPVCVFHRPECLSQPIARRVEGQVSRESNRSLSGRVFGDDARGTTRRAPRQAITPVDPLRPVRRRYIMPPPGLQRPLKYVRARKIVRGIRSDTRRIDGVVEAELESPISSHPSTFFERRSPLVGADPGAKIVEVAVRLEIAPKRSGQDRFASVKRVLWSGLA